MEKKMTKEIIEAGYEDLTNSIDISKNKNLIEAVTKTIDELDKGKIRVAEKVDSKWVAHDWIKKAILLYFSFSNNSVIKGAESDFYDKVPLKYQNLSEKEALENKVRIVPSATARYGSYQAPGVILMPSYVNIGAYVDQYTMVDTWVTVGSCAQIGKNVHLSGGVGIGGVLEPLQATPTIIEDNCFIGARSEIVEGVIVEKGSVISMGVYIGKSTRIYDRSTGEITYGLIPAGSVVVSGNLPSKDGKYSMYAAIIVKKVDEKTLSKVGINNILRDLD
jgi:2,3,4,5-tetrahydropyridine-2-carboxylate N-succinyltransferase